MENNICKHKVLTLILVTTLLTLSGCSKDFSKEASDNSRAFIYGYLHNGTYEAYTDFLEGIEKNVTEDLYAELLEFPRASQGYEEDGYKNNKVSIKSFELEENFKYKGVEDYFDNSGDPYFTGKDVDIIIKEELPDMYADEEEDGPEVVIDAEELDSEDSNKLKNKDEKLLGYIIKGDVEVKFRGNLDYTYRYFIITNNKGKVSEYDFSRIGAN